MATCLKVMRTFKNETGDYKGEVWNYVVQFDSYDTTCRDARLASDGTDAIPPDGSMIAGTSWLSRSTATRNEENPYLYDVQVHFEPQDGKNDPKPPGSDTKWNIQVTLKPQVYERPAHTDKDGAAIVNSAGYNFSETPTYDEYDTQFVISFNTDRGSIAHDLRDSVGHTNSDVISFTYKGTAFSIAVGHAKLTDYSYEFDHDYASDTAIESFKVSITLDVRADGWHDLSLADEGFYDVAGNRFKDTAGQDRVEPTQLDGTGHELTAGTAIPLVFVMKAPVAMASLFAGL